MKIKLKDKYKKIKIFGRKISKFLWIQHLKKQKEKKDIIVFYLT